MFHPFLLCLRFPKWQVLYATCTTLGVGNKKNLTLQGSLFLKIFKGMSLIKVQNRQPEEPQAAYRMYNGNFPVLYFGAKFGFSKS